ncbi:MAG: OB-fold nucleic acid binding domain-containing protein, partial [Firmicutes bacterium]|nr:OB-fold nucleic acid binding domain-containing protein [Bacillota bacterium]
MEEKRDSLAEIEKPFAVEIKIGCTNQSVFGGFDNYVINACRKAMQDFPREESGSKLENLKTLFAGYREMPPNQRRKLIENASRIISQLKGEVLKPAVEAKTKIAEQARSKFIPPLDSEVKFAKGVGPIVAKKLERLRVKTIEDLLFHMPRRYEDRSWLKQIFQLEDGSFETITGITGRAAQIKPRYGLNITKIPVNDGTGIAFLTWFNQPYMKNTLKQGTKVIASGKVEIRYREIQLHNPEFEIISEEEDTINTGRIVPVAITFVPC